MTHPLVGVWTMEVAYVGRPSKQLAVNTFHEDGSMSISTAAFTAQGVWVATSDRSARIRALAPVGPAEGQAAWHTFEATLELAADGNSFALQGRLSRPTPSGRPTETAATATGQRLLPS